MGLGLARAGPRVATIRFNVFARPKELGRLFYAGRGINYAPYFQDQGNLNRASCLSYIIIPMYVLRFLYCATSFNALMSNHIEVLGTRITGRTIALSRLFRLLSP
jgi:hypothetical protein